LPYYKDGTELQDALSGATYSVANGNPSLTLNPISGVVLLPKSATVDLRPHYVQSGERAFY
jgi:hypothetical protein